jgi:sphingosine kinase
LKDSELTISYASPSSKTSVKAATLKYPIEYQMVELVNKWIIRLLDRAYGQSQRKKRAKVLVNPHSGKGSAEKWYYRDVEPLLKAAQCTIDMTKTRHSGEAVEIAEKLDIEAFDIVASCSGDGLPHEVFNGLGKRSDAKKALSKIAVVHIPCGSGNAMSCNLNGTDSASLATLAIIKGIPTPLDLISITQGETRTLSFLSQSVGIVAESDLATEHLRWMGGQRFTYGFLVRLLGKTVYPCDIAVKVAIDDRPAIREHYKAEKTNFEPASERRGYKNLLDDDASATSGNEEGLPALRYGTVNDKLPEGWEMVPYDKLGNFYCGNVCGCSPSELLCADLSRWHIWLRMPISSQLLFQTTDIWI